jgi:hypothetical protein
LPRFCSLFSWSCSSSAWLRTSVVARAFNERQNSGSLPIEGYD